MTTFPNRSRPYEKNSPRGVGRGRSRSPRRPGYAAARDQIQIVGSSTVFPFTTAVAEKLGQGGQFKAPVVESTGTGGGIKLFCAGVGENTPDFTNASRAIKDSELETCKANGVTPVEIKIGFDGIVLANSKAGAAVDLTKEQIFKALAKNVAGRRQGRAEPVRQLVRHRRLAAGRRRSRCSARRRPPARATPSSNWSWSRPARTR